MEGLVVAAPRAHRVEIAVLARLPPPANPQPVDSPHSAILPPDGIQRAEVTQLRDELRAESAERRADFARLSREFAEVRGDIRNLKALMYRLLLVQTIVIVGFVTCRLPGPSPILCLE